MLGGDHGIAEPDIRACAARHGPVGLVHFDTHTDTGTEVFGVEVSHGTPMQRLVEQGHVDPSRYAQIGLRGYWPGEEEFGWQAEHGIPASSCTTCASSASTTVVERASAAVGEGPVFLSVDIDVLDPAFAPGTGTPEPGGMTSAELLRACRVLAGRLELVGAELVEVIPTAVGSADITALPPSASCARSSPGSPCAEARLCAGSAATIASTSAAYLETKLGPMPLIAARASSSAGRAAAIASRVELWATV